MRLYTGSRPRVEMGIIACEEIIEKGGDPGELAPEFFSILVVTVFEKGGVILIHLQHLGP